jgi:hypothetical protein
VQRRTQSEGLRIRLFGPLEIGDDVRVLGPRDLGGARPKQVLEILVAARGRRVPIDRLADLLWGEGHPQNVAGSLQTFVSVSGGASRRTRNGLAVSSSPSPRPTGSRSSWPSSTSIASTICL